MRLLEKEIGVLSKKQYPKIVFIVCFGYIALSIQCFFLQSNEPCKSYLYEVLTVQNYSVDTIFVSYSANDSGNVVLPDDTLRLKPQTVANDTIEAILSSYAAENTLSGEPVDAPSQLKRTRIVVTVSKNNTLTHRNVFPYDTAANWLGYHCDEKYYHFDTIVVQ
jgi:hypothetical protein